MSAVPETTGYKGTLTTMKPRPEVVRDFLNYWFEFTDGNVQVGWRDATTGDLNVPGDLNKSAVFNVRDPQLEEFVCNVNSIGGQDCYFKASIVRNTTGYATDEDVICSPGFWVDQDDIRHIEYADSIKHEFTPTAFVYTGTVPEKRRQLWFRLDEPTRDGKFVFDVNDRLHGLYHGDASVKNPSRYMRLPGTIAWAWKPGRTPELVTWSPASTGPLSHPIELTDTIPLPDPTINEVSGTGGSGKGVDYYIDNILADNGNWHNSVRDLVGHWIMKGRSNREMLLYASAFTRPGYTIEQTEEEILKSIDSFRLKYNAPYREQLVVQPENVFTAKPLTAEELRPADDRYLNFIPADIFVEEYGNKPEMLIEGYLTRGSTTLFTGGPSAGKSPVALHMAVCVALGVPWAGKTAVQGNVLYMAGESYRQTAMNLGTFAQMEVQKIFHGIQEIDRKDALNIVKKRFIAYKESFVLESDVEKLIETIEYHVLTTTLLSGGPGLDLLILDTLRALSIGSINKDEDMTKIQHVLDTIKRRFPNICIILINHASKGDLEGSSGSNRIEAFSETIINIALKKPFAAADDKNSFIRAQTFGPTEDGHMITPFAVSMQRNKTWSPEPPLRASMLIKENNMTIVYGADAFAAEKPLEGQYVEETPFNSEEKKKGSRKLPPPREVADFPQHLREAVAGATSQENWVLQLINAVGYKLGVSMISKFAMDSGDSIWAPGCDPDRIGNIARKLCKDGLIDRVGDGKGSKYFKKGIE